MNNHGAAHCIYSWCLTTTIEGGTLGAVKAYQLYIYSEHVHQNNIIVVPKQT